MNTMTRGDDSYDVVVIGAGHNGLVCASYLARAGKRVLVVERRSDIGGGAATREISPSFTISACAHLADAFDPAIVRDLKLARRGLVLSHRALPTVALDKAGRHIVLAEDVTRATASIAQHSTRDSEAYGQFHRSLARIAHALRPLVEAPPARLAPEQGKDPGARALREADRRLARLKGEERALLDALSTEPLADVLARTFETPLLQGALALRAGLGQAQGPSAPLTGLNLLWRSAMTRKNGRPLAAHARGGLGGLTKALADAAAGLGVTLRTGVGAEALLMEEGRVTGLVLDNGERVRASAIASSADARQTFLALVPRGVLDVETRRRLARTRQMGVTVKVHLALDGLPDFRGLGIPDLGGRLLVAPSLGALDAAAREAAEGRFAEEPVMEVVLATIDDPSLAPLSQHALSILVQYTPYALDGGWEAGRDRFVERVVHTLAAYAPDLTDKIVAGDFLTPPEIEREFAIPGGDWHQGLLAPDQMAWLRPGVAPDGGPLVPGLFLCGAAAHPGGGISGLPGRIAADAILAQERRP